MWLNTAHFPYSSSSSSSSSSFLSLAQCPVLVVDSSFWAVRVPLISEREVQETVEELMRTGAMLSPLKVR